MGPRTLDDVDWTATALPAPAEWPSGLAAVVATVLAAPTPMAVVIGDEFVLVYSPPYGELLGAKHPAAFGRPVREVLAENWDAPGHGDVVSRVYRTGEPFAEADTILPVQRRGPSHPPELVHFSRSYTPVRADDGSIVGVLAVVTETSDVNRALRGVAELTARLSAAASVDNVTREALAYAVDGLGADHARVVLADGPSLRIARRSKVDGTDESAERLPPVWSRLPVDAHLPTAEVTRHGQPLWLGAGDLASYDGLQDEPLAVRRISRIATVPLRTGTVRGALSLAWERQPGFSDAERAAITAVGNLVAQSLARAQRFDEQRGLADTLQLSMLPPSLPQLPGIGLAARYVPSGHGATAGGDFYDAFDVGDGLVAVVIGDVVGHGVEAATVMGQVRAATRVLALREREPAAVLAGLDPFVASLGGESFVTMIVGLLDPVRHTFDVAVAGHPHPLLCRRTDRGYDADVVALRSGAPVGIGGERPLTRLTLQTDDVLVLYTDGLVEVPGEDPDVASARLVAAAAAAAATADPRRICGLLLEQRRATGDDAALLAIAVHGRRHLITALELPAESTSPRQARAWARSTLVGWGVPDEIVGDALLCISELVSNAVLHARSGARVELDLDDTRLLALVSDTGTVTGESVAAQLADPTASRGRGLAVVDQLTTAWGSEQSSRGTTVWFEIAR